MAQILVIDDDPAIRLVLKRTLEKQGHHVLLAEDGASGLALAYEHLPGLIICDWMMPEMDGLKVCSHVRAQEGLAATFFILLTAKGRVEDRIQGLNAGADDFLTKPIDLEELKARIRAGLRLHALSQDLQVQKAQLVSALMEATDYVRSLLPEPMEEPIRIDTRFIPSQQLGGDCFDYYWLDPDYLAIFLLDMSGHGLGAALPSVSVLNMLRSQTLKGVNFYQPNQVLRALNDTFQMNDQSDKYFTIWYGVYCHTRRQLFYSSAGHPPALLVSGDTSNLTIQPLKTPGFPVGMFPDVDYGMGRCRIEDGSALYVFSDGIYEMESTGKMLGYEKLVEFIQEYHVHNSANLDSANLDGLLQKIRSYTEAPDFTDDVSLIQVAFGQSGLAG